MEILKAFESLRTPWLTLAADGITWMASDAVLIIALCALFWLFDRKAAYAMCFATFTCLTIGQMLKLYLAVPRPFVIWPQLRPVHAARVATADYAFPSITTLNAVGTYGMATTFTTGWRRALLLLLPLLVALSRMYQGTNTLLQVAASLVIGAPFVWLVRRVSEARADGMISPLTAIACAMLAAAMLWAAGATAPGSFNPSQALDSYRTMGCVIGLTIGTMIETRWIRFTSRAGWRLQTAKVLLGYGGVGAIYILGEQPIDRLMGPIYGSIFRYALLFVWILAGLPALAAALRPLLEPHHPVAVPASGTDPEERS